MDLFSKLVQDGLLIKAVFSSPTVDAITRVDIRPIAMEGRHVYQAEERQGTQVKHKNLNPAECVSYMELSVQIFKHAVLFTPDKDYYLLRSRKGKLTVLQKPPSMAEPVTPESHDRQKNYFFPDGQSETFLLALGLMDAQGRVKPNSQKKFVQINRFVELLADVLPVFKQDEPMEVVDFGCGKAYLTFAMQAFLERTGYRARLVGVDLKSPVLQNCAKLAAQIGVADRLRFVEGTIDDAELGVTPHMVVALHACDTATDDAIVRAVECGARAILLAPCCQHELHDRLENKALEPILRYGVQRDKLATLVTDSLRALVLETFGYRVDVLEFTAPEHTAKNIMLRAVRGGNRQKQAEQELEALLRQFSLKNPYLLTKLTKTRL